jgi:HK97 family phage portal protein
MSVELLSNGRLRYTYSDPKGGSTIYSQDDIFHLRGRSDDGVLGKTPIAIARETLGLALAEQRHGAFTFANQTRLSGVLQTERSLSEKAFENLKQSWKESYGGLGNTGKPAILESGLKWQPLSMTLDDSELVKNRRFSFEEVARLFRVPPVLIGDLTNANYSNSVELMRHFLVTCLGPHLTRFEQAVMRSLMPDTDRRLYAEFEPKALLQTDVKTRFEAYSYALDKDKGWMTVGEVRKAENLPPLPEQEPRV